MSPSRRAGEDGGRRIYDVSAVGRNVPEDITRCVESVEDWWESPEGHLFVTRVKMPDRDRTMCLRCWKPFEDTWEDEPCESHKDGRWTDLGIESILTTLKEGDDRETTKVINDAAEIIEQLRAAPPAAERTALKAKIEAIIVRLHDDLPNTFDSKDARYEQAIQEIYDAASASEGTKSE